VLPFAQERARNGDGVAAGLGLFVLTIIEVIRGAGVASPLTLLNEYFAGYAVSVKGAFIGLFWGFGTGFVMGWFVAFSRNLVVAASIFWIRTRAELKRIATFSITFDCYRHRRERGRGTCNLNDSRCRRDAAAQWPCVGNRHRFAFRYGTVCRDERSRAERRTAGRTAPGLLGVFLPGYSVTFVGSLIGFVYMFVIGYAVGRVIGTVYNRMVGGLS